MNVNSIGVTHIFIRVDYQVKYRKKVLLFTKDLKQNHIFFNAHFSVKIWIIKLKRKLQILIIIHDPQFVCNTKSILFVHCGTHLITG